MLAGRTPLRPGVVVTFDDGYRDVHTLAFAVLARRGIPATVFVPTGHVGTGRPLLHDRLHGLLARALAAGLPAAGDGSDTGTLLAAAAPALTLRGPVATLEWLLHRYPRRLLELVAGHLERSLGPWEPDPGMLCVGWPELAELRDAGWEIGSHTVSHAVLPVEEPAQVAWELAASAAEIHRRLGQAPLALAYPNGRFTPAVAEAAARAGYELAVTTEDGACGPGADPRRLRRMIFTDGHLRGPLGAYSHALAAGHLAGLFQTLGLARPLSGQRPVE
jgi:peptidoglycan/xylan/chitin deacetylase (PgdA/CDA1 family)